MALRTGTHDLSTLFAVTTQSVAKFGIDSAAEIVQNDLVVHNAIMTDMVSEIADPTDDRQRLSGASTTNGMVEVDDYGRAPTQRDQAPSPVGFPLRSFQIALGWTEKWMELHTPAELAIAVNNNEKAHAIRVRKELQKAIFLSSNYSFVDYAVDRVPLAVKRFANADGMPIPDGPDGQTFDATTHQHYLANATLTDAAALSLVNTILEHGFGGLIRIVISSTDEATWRALTNFIPVVDSRLTLNANANQPDQARLDVTRLDNRLIGYYGAAEVWTKPWGIANYACAYDTTAQAKPVVYRQRAEDVLQGLRLVAQLSMFPLAAQYMEAEFGFGVWTRTNGAVLYFAGGAYVDPTITV